MTICAAQTKPVKGDIQKNIEAHKTLITLALFHGANTIIFPELSITGYEPKLAKELATTADDSRFNEFQSISDASQVTIGIGAPTKNDAGICISMILFQPHQPRQVYSKKYLHADEEPYFVSGRNSTSTLNSNPEAALAICYELSVPEHAENASKNDAKIYIASVAKSADGVEKAVETLSEIAQKYSMHVLMSNCVGEADGTMCAGRSSAWNNKGILKAQLNDAAEGILIFNTEKEYVIEKMI